MQHCKTTEKCTEIYQTVCQNDHYGYQQQCQQVQIIQQQQNNAEEHTQAFKSYKNTFSMHVGKP